MGIRMMLGAARRRTLALLMAAALGLAIAPPAGASNTVTGHLIVARVKGATTSPAFRSALARLGLERPRPVFRTHRDWAIDDWSSTRPGFDPAEAAQELEKLPDVRWAEADQALGSAADAVQVPAPTAPVAPAVPTLKPTAAPRVKSAPPATHTSSLRGKGARAAGNPVPPPTTCTGAGGLNTGAPNDPYYCTEGTAGPYYSEEWNAFCFTPTDSKVSVAAAAPAAPAASGICADGAWANGYQGQGTVIAILDSGIDYYHPDLINQMVDENSDPLLNDPNYPGTASDGHKHGWNFYDDNADPMDFYGHGTGRAGIAAAQADNGIGLAGISPKSKLMAVKVGDTYVVHAEVLAQGAVYAADHGADSINTSLGAVGNSKLLAEAALYAYSKGVTWAAATANEYSDHHNFPNHDTTVWGMGGLTADLGVQLLQTCQSGNTQCKPSQPQLTFLQKANFSNFGGGMTFAAPIDTPSTVAAAEACHKDPLVAPPTGCKGQGGYSLHNGGTSTATPHGAAGGALIRSAGLLNGYCQGHLTLGYTFPTCTDSVLSSNEIRQLLAYTATRVHNDDAPTGNNYPASTGLSITEGLFYPAINHDPHTGWNQWYGYGRPNLWDASLYVAARQVPPEAQLFGDIAPNSAAYAGLRGPAWFGTYDPAVTTSLPIVGHAAAPRLGTGQTFDYTVQVAPCLEPTEADFKPIGTRAGLTAAVDGVLATWSLPVTPGTCADTSKDRAFSFPGEYTVRVLVTVDGADGKPVAVPDPGRINSPAALLGQDRRVLFVRHDTNSHPGFPLNLGTSGESSPGLYDLEGRGELDIIVATADGTVIALRPDGTPVPGWPVSADPLMAPGATAVNGTPPRGQIVSAPAIGDIDGDGLPEVVAASLKGGVYAWRPDGSRVAGFPVAVPPPSNGAAADPGNYCGTTHRYGYATRYADYGSIASPVLGDLEGTGKLDIVEAAGNGCVYALRPDGTAVPGWPVHPNDAMEEPFKIAATPAIGSLNHDGKLDVIVGTEEVSGSLPNTNGRIYAYGPDGKLLTGWPVKPASISGAGVPTVASGIISSPALADFKGDGKLELADGVFLGGTDPQHPVNTYNPDGSTMSTLGTNQPGLGSNESDPSQAFAYGVTQTAIGKLSGALDIVSGGFSTTLATDTAVAPGKKPQLQHLVGAWDAASGNSLQTFPRQIEDWQFLAGPAIADVKGDGSEQVIEGSGGYMIHAFDPSASPNPAINATPNNISTSLSRYGDYPEPDGFPFNTGGYVTSTPAVGQLTRGGPVSVVVMTRDGFLFVVDTKGKPEANNQWWHFHHDEHNTGLYGLDTRPPATTRLSASAGTLAWTAPGDDWWVGTADHYELRCSASPITYSNFSGASQVATGAPKASGNGESAAIPGGANYCAVRSYDKAGNRSQLAFATLGAGGGGGLPNTGAGITLTHLLALLLLPLALFGASRNRRGGRGRGSRPGTAFLYSRHGDLSDSHGATPPPAPGRAIAGRASGTASTTFAGCCLRRPDRLRHLLPAMRRNLSPGALRGCRGGRQPRPALPL
ncbi:MAG: S8 family serine peptidase [Candidatus Dormibacteria bacterium]